VGVCEVLITLDHDEEQYVTVLSVKDLSAVLNGLVREGRDVQHIDFAQLMMPASSNAPVEVGHGWWCVDNQTRFERRTA